MKPAYCNDTIIESPVTVRFSAQDCVTLSWASWLRAGRALLVRQTVELGSVLKTWQIRATSRAHLAHLDDRMLRDIGMTRDEAEHIARKPFWKA